MRNAPAYSADRFAVDFAASLLCAAAVFAVAGPAAWWLVRLELSRNYPGHPELLGGAVLAGLLDGLLFGLLGFAACFAVRIWVYERRERKQSDAMLRQTLHEITAADHYGEGG